MNGSDWLIAVGEEFVEDAKMRISRGDEMSEAVRDLVDRLRELDDEVLQLDVRTSEDTHRPVGAALDARYSGCESWLTAELNRDSAVQSWRGRNLADPTRVAQLLDQAESRDHVAKLIAEYRRQVANNVADCDVYAWVLERFAAEGGIEGLAAEQTRVRQAQNELFGDLDRLLGGPLFHRWQQFFKPISWSDTINLAIPTPDGSGLQTVLRHTSLGDLAELVERLADRHALTPASVTAFIVAGRRVQIAGASCSASIPHGSPHPGSHGTVTMTLDAALQPEQVADSFRRIRDSFWRVRPAATERQGRMVEHVSGRVNYGFESPSWNRPTRKGPGRPPTDSRPRFCVRPIPDESWSQIVSDWNRTPKLAQLGELNNAHASRDFASCFQSGIPATAPVVARWCDQRRDREPGRG